MSKLKSFLLLFCLTFVFGGCASYVDRVHQQIDNEYRAQRGVSQEESQLPSTHMSRQQRQSTQDSRYQPPQVQRQYGERSPQSGSRSNNRVTAEDLRDGQRHGSLWSNPENQLFVQSRSRSSGDIILINVKDRLKREITLELRRAFPSRSSTRQDLEEEEGDNQETERDVAQEDKDRIHDRISSVIIERISREHVLIRGRKNILYQNARRLIEVQALVSTRDITDNDSVDSDDIIESQVSVLR